MDPATGLPRAMTMCENGRCDGDDEPHPMLRCSVCKNTFYCSPKCQKQAWKNGHKQSCSPLPVPLPPIKLEVSEELDAEVGRVMPYLRAVEESWKPLPKKDLSMGMQDMNDEERDARIALIRTPALTALKKIQLSPAFLYPNTHTLSPLTHTLRSLTRLFLMHYISHLPSLAAAEAFSKYFEGCQLPPQWPQLYGPKIVAVPGALSVGEYEMLVQIMYIQTMEPMEMKTKEEDEREGEEEKVGEALEGKEAGKEGAGTEGGKDAVGERAAKKALHEPWRILLRITKTIAP